MSQRENIQLAVTTQNSYRPQIQQHIDYLLKVSR